VKVAEATAKEGGRLKDLKLVLKSASTWPFTKTYDRDYTEARQVLEPPLVVNEDEYDSDEEDEADMMKIMTKNNGSSGGGNGGARSELSKLNEKMMVHVEVCASLSLSCSLSLSQQQLHAHTHTYVQTPICFFKNNN
jgi:hypothetical protein